MFTNDEPSRGRRSRDYRPGKRPPTKTRLEVDKNANFCLIVASRYHSIIGAAQSKPPLRIARKTLTWGQYDSESGDR